MESDCDRCGEPVPAAEQHAIPLCADCAGEMDEEAWNWGTPSP